MILKYLEGDTWVFIEAVKQAKSRFFVVDEAIKQYNEEVQSGKRDDAASIDWSSDEPNKKLPSDVAAANKAFTIELERAREKYGVQFGVNALAVELLSSVGGASVLCVETSEGAVEDRIVILNQAAYLMNDRGQTIERLA